MIELVWDGRTHGTITTPCGDEIVVGGERQLSADDLLAAAVATSLMEAYLHVAHAAGQPTLGYITAGTASRDDRDEARIHIRVLISCRGAADGAAVTALLDAARQASSLCRLLGNRLDVDVACQAFPDGGAPC